MTGATHLGEHMDDSEIIAAIAAGDPAGMSAAYDKYAAGLYGYCSWMLREPALAADALLETFTVAATMLAGLKDPGETRAWLYAVARAECYRRVDIPTEEDAARRQLPGLNRRRRRAPVRLRHGRENAVVIRAPLAQFKPQEAEVAELSILHGLSEAELAVILCTSPNRARAVASRARWYLERDLSALLIARTGQQSCPELDTLLADWDGRLTPQTGKVVADHIEQCEKCTQRRDGTLHSEELSSLVPLAALPPELREPILHRAAASAAPASSEGIIWRARSAGLAAFDRLGKLLGWSRIRANPGSAMAVVAVAGWAVAATIAILLTVTGMHAVDALTTQKHAEKPAATTPAAGNTGPSSSKTSRSPSPRPTSRPTHGGAAPVATTGTPPPTSAESTPSQSAAPSASPSSSVSLSPTTAPATTAAPTPSPASSSPPPSPLPTST